MGKKLSKHQIEVLQAANDGKMTMHWFNNRPQIDGKAVSEPTMHVLERCLRRHPGQKTYVLTSIGEEALELGYLPEGV